MKLEEIREFFSHDRFAMGIGCFIEEAEPGHAVVTLDVEDKHLNGNNVVQGGVLFTIADLASAAAACADGTVSVSANGTINYLAPGDCKKLIATADAVRQGKTISYYEIRVTDENGKLLALSTFVMCRIKK